MHVHTCRYLSVTDVCRAAKLPWSCWVAAGWANVIGEIESLFCLISLILPQRLATKAACLFLCTCPCFYFAILFYALPYFPFCLFFIFPLSSLSYTCLILRAPEPCTGAGEEGGPVTMRRPGYHVWRRAAVWGALSLPSLLWFHSDTIINMEDLKCLEKNKSKK